MNQVGVAVGPDRRPVAVKRATSPSGAERLRHEAQLLHAARHPQVVGVVGFEPGTDDGLAVLTTAWVPGGSLAAASARRRSVRDLVRTLASAAATLSDLHDRGIVHGRIDADHVLVDEQGAAVLCGFADAEQHADAPASDDVAAMGRLIGKLATALNNSGSRRGRLRSRGHADVAERLAAIGRRAADPLASRRPSARALARQLAELVPGPGQARAEPFDGAGRRSPVAVVGGAAVVALVGVIAVLAFLRWRASAGHSTSPATNTTAPATTTTAPADSTVPPTGTSSVDITGVLVAPEPTPASPPPPELPPVPDLSPPDRGAPPIPDPPPVDASGPAAPASTPADTGASPLECPAIPAGTPAVDLDDDGCAEPITIGADGTVTVGIVAFGIGLDPGDQVLVGDWDCDGRPTLAVLRLPSGAVDVFSGWPAEGEPPVVATRVAEVRAATAAQVVPPADGACARINVQSPDGTTVVTPAP